MTAQFSAGIFAMAAVLCAQRPAAPAKTPTSQTPAAGTTAIPDSVLYDMAFRRIADQKKIIARIESLGKDSTTARSYLKSQMGVTAAEYASIEAAAVDFVAAHTANLMQLKQLHDALNGGPVTPSFRQQAAAVKTKDATLMPAHINQLKAAIGPARFQLLDTWARTYILPHITSGSK